MESFGLSSTTCLPCHHHSLVASCTLQIMQSNQTDSESTASSLADPGQETSPLNFTSHPSIGLGGLW